jgi:hypothetical protein
MVMHDRSERRDERRYARASPGEFPAGGDAPERVVVASMDHLPAARVMIGGENYRTVHDGNWSVERRLGHESLRASTSR